MVSCIPVIGGTICRENVVIRLRLWECVWGAMCVCVCVCVCVRVRVCENDYHLIRMQELLGSRKFPPTMLHCGSDPSVTARRD